MIIIGVDEAGRGPLAGPVTAAAVILPSFRKIKGLNDSKLLSIKQREYLFEKIYDQAEAVAVAHASVLEIDQFNILQASLLAMQRAVNQLNIKANLVLVDGNVCPKIEAEQCYAVIGGDALVPEISAASIIAKVSRDREMQRLHEIYPDYGFNQHCGYGTARHLEALNLLGVCDIHRRSFAPVRERLQRS
ncbi:MAG: ribonuclease [Gammaproteobacteria bacterium]|jgi:ribonuclease HII|nr:ribonuclease [Gammaproteobacteria bacterium]